jgi:hypothetical protein
MQGVCVVAAFALNVPLWLAALIERGAVSVSSASVPLWLDWVYVGLYLLRYPMLALCAGVVLVGVLSSPSRRWRVVCLVVLFLSALLTNLYLNAVVRV